MSFSEQTVGGAGGEKDQGGASLWPGSHEPGSWQGGQGLCALNCKNCLIYISLPSLYSWRSKIKWDPCRTDSFITPKYYRLFQNFFLWLTVLHQISSPCTRLVRWGSTWKLWWRGNRSTHIHTLVSIILDAQCELMILINIALKMLTYIPDTVWKFDRQFKKIFWLIMRDSFSPKFQVRQFQTFLDIYSPLEQWNCSVVGNHTLRSWRGSSITSTLEGSTVQMAMGHCDIFDLQKKPSNKILC